MNIEAIEDNVLEELEYRNLLLLQYPVEILGLQVKQFTIEEIIKSKYYEFNKMRQFVFVNRDSFGKEIMTGINGYMLEVKENLVLNYQMVNYDGDYTMFDMVGYVPFINDMFIKFLSYFTNHEINSVVHMPDFDELIIYYDDVQFFNLNRNKYDILIDNFAILNFATGIKENENRIKKTDEAKRFDDEVSKLRTEFGFKEEKPDVTFNSILSFLCNANIGYTHENIRHKTIYQIMDSYMRKNHMEYCKLINSARSQGTLSMNENELKKVNLAFELY